MITSFTMNLSLGRLIKNDVLYTIKSYCLKKDIQFSYVEGSGFFSKDFCFKFTGEKNILIEFEKDLRSYINRINEDEY